MHSSTGRNAESKFLVFSGTEYRNNDQKQKFKGEIHITNNTALQVTNFNFYGDELIALKDNATGEIYTSINSVLRGIGFTNKDQIRKRRDKWINDVVISKGVVKFNIPTQEVVTKNDTTLFDEKDT